MQIAVNIENDTIAQKVLWFLEHLKNDGVEVIKIDDDNEYILNEFRNGLREIKLIEDGKLKSKPIEKLLNEI